MFAGVRQGRYEVTATVFIDGTPYEGSAVVEVTALEEAAVEIVLSEHGGPLGDRPVGHLHIVATLYAYDADWTDRASEKDTQTIEAWVDVTPFGR